MNLASSYLYRDIFEWQQNSFFWRTQQQQEIDYIEKYDGHLHAYEFKWNLKKQARFPRTFLNAYPGGKTAVITSANWTDFVMEEIEEV